MKKEDMVHNIHLETNHVVQIQWRHSKGILHLLLVAGWLMQFIWHGLRFVQKKLEISPLHVKYQF